MTKLNETTSAPAETSSEASISAVTASESPKAESPAEAPKEAPQAQEAPSSQPAPTVAVGTPAVSGSDTIDFNNLTPEFVAENWEAVNKAYGQFAMSS